MGSPDLREKLVNPTAVVVIGGLILAGILTAARSALFWAIVGGIAAAVVIALVVRAFVHLGRETRELRDGLAGTAERIQAIAAGVDREGRALNELNGEVVRLRRRLALVERVALPEWLRVAIAFNLERGGHVDPEPNGLRFSERDRREILMLRFPVPEDDGNWSEKELHRRLGIGQEEYLEALLHPEPTLDAERQASTDRLHDLEAQLDAIRDLVERKGFGRILDAPPGD